VGLFCYIHVNNVWYDDDAQGCTDELELIGSPFFFYYALVPFLWYCNILYIVYVLNYSWVFGGIWQMLKRALPESARARVSFPSSTDELWEHFDREDLSTGKRHTTKTQTYTTQR
jgi:hypothetical protein